MNEFVTVSSSSYDPASLAAKLTEKSAQGWEIVAIVPTGGDVTAFLQRGTASTADSSSATSGSDHMSSTSSSTSPSSFSSSSSSDTSSPASTPEPVVSEPAGWAVAPDPSPASNAPATVIQGATPMASIETPSYSSAPAAPAQPAQPVAPSVPAGWYADPAGRFDLRYWDGGTWTEHVSRAGQQYTDAPVA